MYIKPHIVSDDEAEHIFDLARSNNGQEFLRLVKAKPQLLWAQEKATELYPAALFAMHGNSYIVIRLAEIEQNVLWQKNKGNTTVVKILAENNNSDTILRLAKKTPTILIQEKNPAAISLMFAERGDTAVVLEMAQITNVSIDKKVIFTLAKQRQNHINAIIKCFELKKDLIAECGIIMPLFARRNNIGAVMQLAEVSESFLNATYKGRTATYWLARQNNAKAVLMLAKEYPWLIEQTWQGRTVAVIFAIYGNIDSTIRLVDEFTKVLWQEYKGVTISAMLHEPALVKKLRI